MMKNKYLIFIYLLCGNCAFAQQVLSDTAFIQLVVAQNPKYKQLSLLNLTAQSEIQAARGNFDPKLYGDFEQKQFNGAQYYSQGEYGLKVPTWYGVELKAAYLNSSGLYLNPEYKFPKSGQPVLGLSLPLLQGLTFDERRSQVLKSRTFTNASTIERAVSLNDLLLEALEVFWKWQYAYEQKIIVENALNTAQKRFVATKKLFEQGDRMAMDTLEGFIQVQDREILLNETVQELNNSFLKAKVFIFDSTLLSPGTNSSFYIPPRSENLVFDKLNKDSDEFNIFNVNHPALKQYDIKLEQLDIDLRLKKEKLKPKLNINYNFLGDGFSFPSLLNDNYKWGIQFSSGTLFRNERADVQLTKIKIQNSTLMRLQKKQELENKWQVAVLDFRNNQQQLELNKLIATNYEQLLRLENKRFTLGESSFFLINSRELKLLEAQLKIAKLKSALQTAFIRILYAQGKLSEF